jgi:putative membrane protein
MTTISHTSSAPAPRQQQARLPIAAILAISALASAFLFWLVYAHQAPAAYAMRLRFLPALNALFNGLSAIALVVGFSFIRRRNIAAHRASMLTAFAFSSLFLASYITNHALHGDIIFPGHGLIRTLYLMILSSHIFLSVFALPMVLITFFFALSGRFQTHRKIARWTYPIWLYVSVTGVIVGVMLAGWHA